MTFTAAVTKGLPASKIKGQRKLLPFWTGRIVFYGFYRCQLKWDIAQIWRRYLLRC